MLRHGDGSSAIAGVPAPKNKKRVHVLDNLRNSAVSVPRGIFKQLAKLVIAQTFPDHRRGRGGKSPIGCAGWHVQAVEVVILVAGAAPNGVGAMTIGTALDVHDVGMAVVSLTREVSAGMTVHAAWMMKNGNDGFEGLGGSDVVSLGR